MMESETMFFLINHQSIVIYINLQQMLFQDALQKNFAFII